MTVVPASLSDSAPAMVPVSVDGPHGAIRLKWHKLRTHFTEAPFKPRNLALGWRLGASLEIDILAAADQASSSPTTQRSVPPRPAAAA